MKRLVDKALVLACCMAGLALGGAASQAMAACLCLAIIASAAAEALFSRGHRSAATGVALASCLANALVPPAVPLVPLACYDLSRSPRAPIALALAGAVALPLLASIVRGMAPLAGPAAPALPPGALFAAVIPTLAPSLLLALVATLLSLRTTRIEEQQARARRQSDDLREHALSLASANRDLAERVTLEAQLAALSERARIARDIHDSVGHLLTRACLQIEALRVVHAGEEQAQAELAGVAGTLAQALATVRASVHGMRDEAADLSVQIAQLAREMQDATGLVVDAEVSVEHAPADVCSCVLAIIREAASNALRHGGASHLRVRCLEHPAFWQLVITDDGSAGAGAGMHRICEAVRGKAQTPSADRAGVGSAPSTMATRGMGLASMRERVEALGGHFRAGLDEGAGGFRVFASIPKPVPDQAGATPHPPATGPVAPAPAPEPSSLPTAPALSDPAPAPLPTSPASVPPIPEGSPR